MNGSYKFSVTFYLFMNLNWIKYREINLRKKQFYGALFIDCFLCKQEFS